MQKNYSLALWVCSYPSILYLYWFESRYYLRDGGGASELCPGECSACWLPTWALCRGLLALTIVMRLGAANVASSLKWPFCNNLVVVNKCKKFSGVCCDKLFTPPRRGFTGQLCWAVLKVGGHQYQSSFGNISYLAHEVNPVRCFLRIGLKWELVGSVVQAERSAWWEHLVKDWWYLQVPAM